MTETLVISEGDLVISVIPQLVVSNKGIENWVYKVWFGLGTGKGEMMPLGTVELDGCYTPTQLGDSINRILEGYKNLAIKKPFTVKGETITIPLEKGEVKA